MWNSLPPFLASCVHWGKFSDTLYDSKKTEPPLRHIHKDYIILKLGEANSWASLQSPGLFLWELLSSCAPCRGHFLPLSPASNCFIFVSVIYSCTTDNPKFSGFKRPCYCFWLFGLGIWAGLSGDSSSLFDIVIAEVTGDKGSKMASLTCLEPQLAVLAGVWLSVSVCLSLFIISCPLHMASPVR